MGYNTDISSLLGMEEEDIKSFSYYLRTTIERSRNLFVFDTSMFSPSELHKTNEFIYYLLDNNNDLEERVSHAKKFLRNLITYNHEIAGLFEYKENTKITGGVKRELKKHQGFLLYIRHRIKFFLERNSMTDEEEFNSLMDKLKNEVTRAYELCENPNNLLVSNSEGYHFNKLLRREISNVSKKLVEKEHHKPISETDKALVYVLFNENLSGYRITLLHRDRDIRDVTRKFMTREFRKVYGKGLEREIHDKIIATSLPCYMPRTPLNYYMTDVEVIHI